jgi:hypothetical protein
MSASGDEIGSKRLGFPDAMDEAFKIVKVRDATDEILTRVDNYEICKAAFEKALFVYPEEHLEMRQGARIILKSKEA